MWPSSRRTQFRTAVSIHTYSDVWLSPYGYATLYPENKPQYDEIQTLATEVNGYPAGPASILLYLANGVTATTITSRTARCAGRRSWAATATGFWPPSNRIVPLAQENLLGLQRSCLAGRRVGASGLDGRERRGRRRRRLRAGRGPWTWC